MKPKLLTICALTLALITGSVAWSASALAAGSSSSSSRTTGEDKAAKRYAKAVKEIKKGDYEDAIKLLKKVVREQPDNADAYNQLGYSHRKLKEFAAARKNYLRALDIEPSHRGALEYLGELYLDTGDPENAKAMLSRLAEACPSGCEEKDELNEKIADYQKQ